MAASDTPSNPAPASRQAAPRARVVVVDDEEDMCRIVARILGMEGYEVVTFCDPLAAIEHIRREGPELVLTDMKMPGASGLDVLRAAREANPAVGVVVATAYGSIEGGVEAMREGAQNYITKPWKIDELVLSMDRALEKSRLLRENESLNETLRRSSAGSEIIGTSDRIAAVRDLIAKAAPTDAAVLIRGESGTGKEMVAKAIHAKSQRRKRRFVAINCASIPENLLESELFGYERGAFTGADRMKMGLVELAHEGTLFLDEIGDLPMALQAKLLRVLQEREIQRVGGLHAIPVDVRLVAASNRDLKEAIAQREFRADLFFRLDVITITMPPLRERVGDVPVLVEHFLAKSRRKFGRGPSQVSPDAMTCLESYVFPGNVRELENIIERAVVLCDSDTVEIKDLPADVAEAPPRGDPNDSSSQSLIAYRGAKERFERRYLQRIVAAAKGNMSEAARMAGLSRRHLYEKLEKLGVHFDRAD